jgi:hypothetical protein
LITPTSSRQDVWREIAPVVGQVTLISATSPTEPAIGLCWRTSADPVYAGLEVDRAPLLSRTSKVWTVPSSGQRIESIADAATSCLKVRARDPT